MLVLYLAVSQGKDLNAKALVVSAMLLFFSDGSSKAGTVYTTMSYGEFSLDGNSYLDIWDLVHNLQRTDHQICF
jgi:hypothetical protein